MDPAQVKIVEQEEVGMGRCLTGFEICRLLKLTPAPVPEQDLRRMEGLFFKWRGMWESKYDSKGGDNVVGDHWLSDLYDWLAFAERNYHDSLPQYPSVAVLIASVLPFLLTMNAK